ncbi:unnamed protein product [Arabidopsis thaliana]|uniref:(thale cress) hypothetical protein n=1 Tax=Arabidopsis thaliana TaxID=3702 RepID=A0A7G2F0M2_ARATH|nr:unnamed protein product [Arabidopsis thaliana]
MFGKGSSNGINAPLKYFSISNNYRIHNFRGIEKMPDWVEARIAVTGGSHKYLKEITYAKGLYVCLSVSEVMNPYDMIFHMLVDLTICTCTQGWWDLLTHMLQGVSIRTNAFAIMSASVRPNILVWRSEILLILRYLLSCSPKPSIKE